MRAGKLNKVIKIQNITGYTEDTFGGDVPTWTDFVASTRAEVAPLRGKELIAAQAAQSSIDTRFRTRYHSGVKSGMRIVYAGAYYDISSVIDPDEKHKELQILASTGVNEG